MGMSRIRPECLDPVPSERPATADVLVREESDEDEEDEDDDGTDDCEDEDHDEGYSE